MLSVFAVPQCGASDEGFKYHGVFLKHVADVGGSGGEDYRFHFVDGEIVADR
jgi:hypothetical protein